MKILVIDDEKPTLSMFRLFLAAYGYDVHTAENGEDGMAVFHSVKPEIVFTDIRMPGMDGLEVLRQIRQTDQACQVIIITGHGDLDRALDAMDMNASDFINKPVERQALNSALMRAEQRAEKKGNDQQLSLSLKEGTTACELQIRGRMTGKQMQGENLLTRTILQSDIDDRVVVEFCSDFSIDRSGLTALTTVLRAASDQGARIELKGLSFNYIRFFEMAGIDKLARIHPPVVEEPGL